MCWDDIGAVQCSTTSFGPAPTPIATGISAGALSKTQ